VARARAGHAGVAGAAMGRRDPGRPRAGRSQLTWPTRTPSPNLHT
jgi:hypothetical protein